MAHNPLEIISRTDPALYAQIDTNRKLALEAGALSHKTKLLIALALDAAALSEGGVRSLAQQALAAGATPEEIMETLRVVCMIDGVGSIYTAARALEGVFDGA